MDSKDKSKLINECLALVAYKPQQCHLRSVNINPQSEVILFKHKKTPKVT